MGRSKDSTTRSIEYRVSLRNAAGSEAGSGPTTKGAEMTLRGIKDGPFYWASKAAKRMIRQKVGDMKNGASILATYSALCELASDRQSEAFDAQHKEIADKA